MVTGATLFSACVLEYIYIYIYIYIWKNSYQMCMENWECCYLKQIQVSTPKAE